MLDENPQGIALEKDAKEARVSNASDKIVHAVVRGLYEGKFVPGQRLAEPDLVTEFGVSRSTARESIRRLEATGVVEVLTYRGAQIRKLTPEEARDALLVLEVAVGLAARLAAERIDHNNNRGKFQEIWRELWKFKDDPDSFEVVRARNRFYHYITLLSENKELQRIVPNVQVHLIRRSYSLPREVRFSNYQRIADAILRGDGVAAESAVRDHIRETAGMVKKGDSL